MSIFNTFGPVEDRRSLKEKIIYVMKYMNTNESPIWLIWFICGMVLCLLYKVFI